MAIIPGIPGLKATILVRDRQAEEYADPDADADDEDEDEAVTPTKQITRYITSEEGADFAMKWEYDSDFPFPGDSAVVSIYVDGRLVDDTVEDAKYRLGSIATGTVWKSAIYTENGTWKQKGFRFAKLVTTEEGSTRGAIHKFKDLGIITIKFVRAVKGTVRAQEHVEEKKMSVEAIAEKKLKGEAVSHRVTMGEAKNAAQRNVAEMSYPWGRDPFATFRFKYRSRKDLQTLGLIPRSPSPVPLEDRDVDELTPEELRELVRQQRIRSGIKNELKRERPANDDTDDEDVIEVVHSRRSKKAMKVSVNVNTGIETIDLSGD